MLRDVLIVYGNLKYIGEKNWDANSRKSINLLMLSLLLLRYIKSVSKSSENQIILLFSDLKLIFEVDDQVEDLTKVII